MTYSREVTNKIVECWGLGFTAEETVKAIQEWKGITIALGTVYNHRHSITAQQIIDELMRKQMRDIAREDNSAVRMKYRDKLLEKLVPHRIEAHTVEEVTIDEKHVTIIADYNRAVEAAVNRDLAALRARQHVDTPQPNAEAS